MEEGKNTCMNRLEIEFLEIRRVASGVSGEMRECVKEVSDVRLVVFLSWATNLFFPSCDRSAWGGFLVETGTGDRGQGLWWPGYCQGPFLLLGVFHSTAAEEEGRQFNLIVLPANINWRENELEGRRERGGDWMQGRRSCRLHYRLQTTDCGARIEGAAWGSKIRYVDFCDSAAGTCSVCVYLFLQCFNYCRRCDRPSGKRTEQNKAVK